MDGGGRHGRGRHERFVQRDLAALEPGETTRTLWDGGTAGLCLRMTPKGAKAYYLVYRMGGRGSRVRWLRLGGFRDLPLARARELARAYRAQVDAGADPADALARKAAAGATVADAADRFMREYAPANLKPGSRQDYAGTIRTRILPCLGRRSLAALDRAAVALWHSSSVGPGGEGAASANKALRVLSSICTQAEIWGVRQDGANPCRHVKMFPETPRARDIRPWELEAVGAAMAKVGGAGRCSPWTMGAIKVIALCAGRVSEIISLRHDRDLFLEDGYALLRDHKTSRTSGARRLELPPGAVGVIAGLPRPAGCPWVFPARSLDAHVPRTTLRSLWGRICGLAGVSDLHLHDFRSYAASEGLEQGIDARVTAKLLGHSSSKTTERHYLNVRRRKTAEAAAAIAVPVAMAFGLKM
jgi:integrase